MRSFTYGESNALMVLVAEAMGLAPAMVDDARQLLQGVPLHPMTGAAMEREAIRINDLVREQGESAIRQANSLADRLKDEYQFSIAPERQ